MLKGAHGNGGRHEQPALLPPSLFPSHAWPANFKWQSYLGATWSLTYLTSSTR